MYHPTHRNVMLGSLMVCMFIFILSFAGMVSGQENVLEKKKEVLINSPEINMETLELLFTKIQKIEGMQNEQKSINFDAEKLYKEIADMEKMIASEEAAYLHKKEGLKQFLQTYQRMGPVSYLEIIMGSNDLSDFLKRLDLLRDITSNTGQLLEQIELSRNRQSVEKSKLASKLDQIKQKQESLKVALTQEKFLKEELEKNLSSLAGEKGNYQEVLAEMKQKWEELQPFFTDTLNKFAVILEEKSIPPTAMKLNVSFFNISGSIEAQSLNKFLAEDPRLPNIIFTFKPGTVEINIPEKHLILGGNFVIHEGRILQFEAKKGSFYGLNLEASSMAKLFTEQNLRIDLTSTLHGYSINSIDIEDGYLKFTVIPQ